MPLPNLRDRSLINASHGPSTTTDSTFPSGAPSYREIIREKILNTPRQNSQEHHTRRSIDLTISRENMYRSSSRLSHQPQSYRSQGDDSSLESAIEWASKNSGSVSSRRRQVVFYNKTYVPSDEDGLQKENETVIQNDENEDYDENNSRSPNRNRVKSAGKQKVNSRFNNRNNNTNNSSFDQNDSDHDHRKHLENSRPNSIETNYNIEDNSDNENVEHTYDQDASTNRDTKSSSYLSRRGGSFRGNQRNHPFPDLNSSSSLDISNKNYNESNSLNNGRQPQRAAPVVARRNNVVITPRSNQIYANPYHDLNSPSSSDFNNYNNRSSHFERDNENFSNNNSRTAGGGAAPAITKRNFKNSSYTNNTNRKSLNLDHFSNEKGFDTRSTNDFNLRSASRTSFRDDDDINESNHSDKNKNYPIPTPRKRLENVTQTLDNNKDFRIRRSTQSNSRGAILATRVSSHTSNNKNSNLEREPDDISDSPPSFKYQRQKSAILKPTEFYESRNSGRLSSLNYYPNDSNAMNNNASARLNSNESNNFVENNRHRHSSRNNFVNQN
jgi:hypothetical protein